MVRLSIMWVLVTLGLLSGCQERGSMSQLRDTGEPIETPADAAIGVDTVTGPARAEPFHIVAPGEVNDGLLVTASVCATCHTTEASATAMRDSAGRDISPFELWQGTMKANAARDPFFLATLSVERERVPELAAAVDQTCFTCHAPLATLEASRRDTAVSVFDLAQPTKAGLLGADGVTCTSCHGITPEGAGTPDVWDGAHVYSATAAVFGPHRDPFMMPMREHTGLTPTYGEHMLDSAVCSSCHTLMTHAIGVADAPEFPEQTPFLEWQNSRYAEGSDPVTCQDCHMPTSDADGVAIATRIARRPPGGDFPPTSPRSPYGRHIFVGGNTLIPEIFKRYRGELLATAPDRAFDATIAAAREQLGSRTARVTLEDVAFVDGRVRGIVRVENLAGHKFPSGYPSRRAWLHIKVLSAAGATLFESGGWDAEGRLIADGQAIASETPGTTFEPHRQTIETSSDVQVWEAIIGDKDGRPVIGLLRAVSYLKDNRLLPAGWRADGPYAERSAPHGVAGDADFVAGQDAVALNFAVAGQPASIIVEVRYQVLSARWAAELFASETPDVRAFESMVGAVGLTPELVGEARFQW